MSLIHKLGTTDTAIRGKLKPGRHSDGGGLYLQVVPTKPGEDGKSGLSKSWIFRYRSGATKTGKPAEREMGLGTYPDTGIAEAREKAADCRRLRDNGVDPLADRDTERARKIAEAARAMTFRECAEAYIANRERQDGLRKAKLAWRNPKHRQQWKNTLATYVYPIMGNLPVSVIETPLVLKVLEQFVTVTDSQTGKEIRARFWDARPETANRVRGRIETILDSAKARGLRTGENPARYRGHIAHTLELNKRVENHTALPYAELPDFLRELQAHDGMAALALQFLILTAARTSEVLGAHWAEIDERAAVWSIPPERMKAGKPHRVPLSDATLNVLKVVAPLRQDGLVFPGAKIGRPLSNMAMLELLRGTNKRIGTRTLTAHGFRSTFRTWTAEQTSFPREVAEAALAHAIESKVEAAYQRGDLFDRRRELMAAWGGYCAPKSNVVSLLGIRAAQ